MRRARGHHFSAVSSSPRWKNASPIDTFTNRSARETRAYENARPREAAAPASSNARRGIEPQAANGTNGTHGGVWAQQRNAHARPPGTNAKMRRSASDARWSAYGAGTTRSGPGRSGDEPGTGQRARSVRSAIVVAAITRLRPPPNRR
jgi:hypothetical protein